MKEPSVLDYVKSLIFFWREERIRVPSLDEGPIELLEDTREKATPPPVAGEVTPTSQERPSTPKGEGWRLARVLAGLLLALLAQRILDSPGRSWQTAVVLYFLAAGFLLWSTLRREWTLPPHPKAAPRASWSHVWFPGVLIASPLALLAFWLFGDNRFTPFNLFLWGLAIAFFIAALWQPVADRPNPLVRLRAAWRRFLREGITLSPWTLLVFLVFAVAAFYRFYRLDLVPAEMFSDHAEKLLDVRDVLNGETRIFFPRNTGREAFQMYLTAAMALVFKTGLSFLSLKLGTALCGLFTLPFIYLLGKEVANRRVGLWAMFFAGIAYWPNVISRVALRFTLYPFFTAPAMYFLVRGLRRRSRNDFILAGIALGLGLHGYSPYRFVPLVMVAGVLIYLLHRSSREERLRAIEGLGVVASVSLFLFLPLLRYALANPAMFSYRMLTRMGQAERLYPGSPVGIFLGNLWKAGTMFFWDNGQIWVHSIPYRPALGVVSAALFFIGLLFLVLRYFRERSWLDLFVLVSIPLLLMPSVLSLAFPGENPSLNRTGGALIPVFLIVGLAFDGLLTSLKSSPRLLWGRGLVVGVAVLLLGWSASQNYDLVFHQYHQQFRANAWNTSELGAVIRQFADSYGEEDSAWVVPYPHWVDTRLVGIRAGFPERDYALWREDIVQTLNDPRAKLFLVKPEDDETIALLRQYYPTGVLKLFESDVPGRDFYMFSVPPAEPGP